MPEVNQPNSKANKTGQANRNPFSAAYTSYKLLPIGLHRIIRSAGILLLILVLVSIFLPNMKERVKFFTESVLSLFVLLVVAMQAYIYQRQREAMDKQSSAIEGQLRLMRSQTNSLAVQAEASLEQRDLMEGASVRAAETAEIMRGQLLAAQSQLAAMQNQERAQFDALEETRKIVGQNERTIETTQKSIEVAEKTSIYANRAYVVAKIRDIGERDETLQFRLRIENSGNTPANDVVVVYSYGLRDKSPHSKPPGSDLVVYDIGYMETERLGVIAPNGSYQVISTPEVSFNRKWSPDKKWSEDEAERFNSGELSFYCWGRIVYEDIFNERRQSEFCFVQSIAHPNGYPCQYGNYAM